MHGGEAASTCAGVPPEHGDACARDGRSRRRSHRGPTSAGPPCSRPSEAESIIEVAVSIAHEARHIRLLPNGRHRCVPHMCSDAGCSAAFERMLDPVYARDEEVRAMLCDGLELEAEIQAARLSQRKQDRQMAHLYGPSPAFLARTGASVYQGSPAASCPALRSGRSARAGVRRAARTAGFGSWLACSRRG